MTPRKDQRKVNGHAGRLDRANGGGPSLAGVNGNGLASTHRDGVPVQQERAASDDASGVTVARNAGFVAASAAPDRSSTKDEIPGGEFPLPADPGEFVEEIHRRADLFAVWQRLLNHGDPKIQQRAVEKLTEMRYKGASALADEPQQIVIDIDSAVARRAAEGARK